MDKKNWNPVYGEFGIGGCIPWTTQNNEIWAFDNCDFKKALDPLWPIAFPLCQEHLPSFIAKHVSPSGSLVYFQSIWEPFEDTGEFL